MARVNRLTAVQAGDTYRCQRCGQDHVVEQPYADRSTAEREHLYVTCHGQRYFVGIAAAETESRAR